MVLQPPDRVGVPVDLFAIAEETSSDD